MIAGGLKCPVEAELRDDIWIKLWGNLCFNPISALTHATLDVIATEPGTRGIARNMMLEAEHVGGVLGARFRVGVDRRIDGAAAVRRSLTRTTRRGSTSIPKPDRGFTTIPRRRDAPE